MMQEICILFLFTVVSVIADTGDIKLENPVLETNAETIQLADNGEENPSPEWTEWKTTRDGIKWLPNCDFPGYDIKYEYIGGRCSHCKCSELCTDTSGCNAFSWMDGWCYLKNLPAAALKRSLSSGGGCGCGFLPWEFE